MHVQYRRPQNALRFLSRDAMLARYMRSSRVMQSVYPSVCLSVRPSQAGIASQRLGELSWRLPSTCAALCYKEIWVGLSSKIRVLSSAWHFVPNSGLGKFRRGKSIALSTKLVVVVDGRVCWRHLYDNRRVVAVYYKYVSKFIKQTGSYTAE